MPFLTHTHTWQNSLINKKCLLMCREWMRYAVWLEEKLFYLSWNKHLYKNITSVFVLSWWKEKKKDTQKHVTPPLPHQNKVSYLMRPFKKKEFIRQTKEERKNTSKYVFQNNGLHVNVKCIMRFCKAAFQRCRTGCTRIHNIMLNVSSVVHFIRII